MYPVFGHTVPYNTSSLHHILFVMNIVLLLWAESKTKGVCHTLTRNRKKGRIGMWKKVWDGCTHSNLETYSVPMLCPGICPGYATLIHTGTTGTDRFLVAQLTSEQINLGWQAL